MDTLKKTILVVDDVEGVRETLRNILEEDFDVITVASGKEALKAAKKHNINVVLLDVMLPDISGIDVLKELKDAYMDMEIIMISAINDVDTAVDAMQNGAFDFITKVFDVNALRAKIWKVIEALQQKKAMMYLQDEVKKNFDSGLIIGKSASMKKINEQMKKICVQPLNVLLTGESGTGKDLIAKTIWKMSDRKSAPFVAVNIASIPSGLIESTLFGHEKGAFTGAVGQYFGKFEQADNGYLFLDEIGELQYDLQAKILRAIQENEIERVGGKKSIKVKVRLISATNANLEEKVRKNEFREDLYYRLKVVELRLPPLRERIEDIPVLANFFLGKAKKKLNKKHPNEISKETLTALSQHTWRGNIRQLENLIENLVVFSEKSTISLDDLPIEYQIGDMIEKSKISSEISVYDRTVSSFKKNLLLQALYKAEMNKTKAASILGIPLSSFKYKLNKFGIYEMLGKKGGNNFGGN